MHLAIYILSSVVVLSIGLILLIVGEPNSLFFAIGSSLVAGGFSSIAFSLIKYFDDKQSKLDMNEIRSSMQYVERDLKKLKMGTVAIDDPLQRCVFNQLLSDEFSNLIKEYENDDILSIDIMGLSLYRFYKEQFQNIMKHNNVHMRIIVQNPYAESTKVTIQMEGRDEAKIINEIITVSKAVMEENRNNSNIEIRWFNDFPSMTLDRVNHTLYVRPRFLEEASGVQMCFERFTDKDSKVFNIYMNYFEAVWERSIKIVSNEQGELIPENE